jgi:hypothetical protein
LIPSAKTRRRQLYSISGLFMSHVRRIGRFLTAHAPNPDRPSADVRKAKTTKALRSTAMAEPRITYQSASNGARRAPR